MKISSISSRLLKVASVTFVAIAAVFGTSKASAQAGYYASGAYASPQAAAYYQQQQAAAYYHQQQQQAAAAYYAQQQAAAYYYQQQQQQQAAYQAQMARQQAAARVQQQPPAAKPARGGSLIRFDGRYAAISASTPVQVQYAVNAANYIQGKPYVRGAGHRHLEDRAYDCSSSTSYALIKAGLLRSPLTSQGFATYGEAGEGRFITIWVKPGEHVFMTICGLRLDTSGGSVGEGPRWRTKGRSMNGFFPRHPSGL